MNLRHSLPNYDTPHLADEWELARTIMENHGETGVPCTMTLGSRRILFQVCRAIEARDVLDIGTFTGSSAAAFALAAERVVSVDIQDVNAANAHWLDFKRPCNPRQLAVNIGVSHKIDFVAMDSVAFLTHTTRKFDFICLDGWHECEAVFAEIPLAIEKLNPGGLIFLDDVQTNGPPPGNDFIPGPLQALEKHLLNGTNIAAHFLTSTLEGEPMAAALLTKGNK